MPNQTNVKGKINTEPDESKHPLLELNRLIFDHIGKGWVRPLGTNLIRCPASAGPVSLNTILIFKSPSSGEKSAIKISAEILDDVEFADAGYDPKQLFAAEPGSIENPKPEVVNDN